MRFVDDREGPAALVARYVMAYGVALAVVAAAGTARAAPLEDPFVGGMSFTGPTSPSLSAIYWNPAALGLVRGTQIMVAGSVRLSTTTVTRAPIDPQTGLPGTPTSTFAPGAATANDVTQPVQWPIGPGAFLGISSDLGGDRFTIGFATYMPYLQQTKFALSAPPGSEPTRYQALQIDLRNLALVPALSIRFAGDFRVGIAPGFLFSTGRLAFAEDTALDGLTKCGGKDCGVENPQAAARYDVSSGNGLGDAKFSVTLGGGVYYRRGALELGLSYQSRPIGSSVPGVEVAGERTTATAPPAVAPTMPPSNVGALVSCPTGSTSRCVFGDMSYRLPDVWIGGATWHLRPGLEVTAMARWIWFHVHDRIDIRLTGPTLETLNVPEHIVIYRGFKDVWDLRGRVAYWFRERVRLGAQLRVETSAVDSSAVNAAAVDGLTIQPMGLAEGRLTRHVWLSAGYGVAFMGEVTNNNSAFNPAMETACVMASNALDACSAHNAGQGRPTAAGTYTRVVQDFGLTMTAKF